MNFLTRSCLLIVWHLVPTAAFCVSNDSLYYEQFKEFRLHNIDKAKLFALRSYRAAQASMNYPMVGKAAYALGYCYSQLNQIDSAIWYYKDGIRVCQKHQINDRLIALANDIANVFESIDLYDSALIYYNISRNGARAQKDTQLEAIALNNTAMVNFRINNLSEAVRLFKESLALAISLSPAQPETIDLIRSNLALVYRNRRDYEMARVTYKDILNNCRGNCQTLSAGTALDGLGNVEFEEGNLKLAESYFISALDIFKKLEDKEMEGNTLSELGKLYILEGDLDKATYCLTESERIGKRIHVKRLLRDVYESWSVYHEKLGDLSKSLYYKDLFIATKDSIFRESMANNVRAQYLAQKQKENNALISEKNSVIERNRAVAVMVAIIAALSVLLTLTFYRNYKIKTGHAARLNREVALVTEEVRRSYQDYDHLIYRTSHDIRGPLATTLGLVSLALRESKDPVISDYLRKIEVTAKKLDSKVTKMAQIAVVQNQKPKIEPTSLPDLVRSVKATFENQPVFPLITVHVSHRGSEIVNTDKEMLSFILSTLLENAYRYYDHAKPDRFISIFTSVTNGALNMIVSDNGIGIGHGLKGRIFDLFVVGTTDHGDGIGLFLARRAAAVLKGSLLVTSESNPTTFSLTLPSQFSDTNSVQSEQGQLPR